MRPARFLGICFFLIFLAHVCILIAEGYPVYLLWFSNHWALFLAFAAFRGSRYWIHALLNIGLIGESIWIIDFLSTYFGYGSPFGSTAYMFSQTYPQSMYIGGLFHLVILLMAFYLFWKWGSDKEAWTGSFIYGGALIIASTFFSSWNINCVQKPCATILYLLPNYSFTYPLLMIAVILITHLLLLLHKREES